MTKPNYESNWRGARRYRFDEETRLKKEALEHAGSRLSSMKGWFRGLPIVPMAFLMVGTAGAAYSGVLPISQVKAMLPGSGCTIKGNISISGGRIYHVPGQRYYLETRIAPHFGERWFCSEAEARRAGWRRAKI